MVGKEQRGTKGNSETLKTDLQGQDGTESGICVTHSRKDEAFTDVSHDGTSDRMSL